MLSLLSGLALTSCVILTWLVVRMRPLVTGLTLIYSWTWALAASIAVMIATVLGSGLLNVPAGWRSLSQLFAVTMLLTPAVATLGARRPGVIAWQGFVVTPLILVLLWPGVSQLTSSRGQEPLELSVPALAGIIIVLTMSAGTSLGTAMTGPFLMYVAGVVFAILPSTGWASADSILPLLTAPLLMFATWLGKEAISKRYAVIAAADTKNELVDQTWRLFQDLYGLVWALRVQDRVNQFALREQWTVRLTLDGFRSQEGNSASDEDLQKPRDAFRWVLGRFASEQWVASRLFRLG